jgi:hypothetical protein
VRLLDSAEHISRFISGYRGKLEFSSLGIRLRLFGGFVGVTHHLPLQDSFSLYFYTKNNLCNVHIRSVDIFPLWLSLSLASTSMSFS